MRGSGHRIGGRLRGLLVGVSAVGLVVAMPTAALAKGGGGGGGGGLGSTAYTYFVNPAYTSDCPDPAVTVTGQFKTIQDAIDCAADNGSGYTIRVAPGDYMENLWIKGPANLIIVGAGASLTTVDGQQYHSTITVDDSFEEYGRGSVVTITGMTIANGRGRSGGGVFNGSGNQLTLKNDVIADNEASAGGGVFSAYWAQLTLDGTTVRQNTAREVGGGAASEVRGDCGGRTEELVFRQFYCIQNQLNIRNSTVIANIASGGGGAALLTQGTASISNSVFSGNVADEGGGLLVAGASQAAVDHTTFTNNTAYVGGGIASDYSAQVAVSSSLFSGNDADNGGGLYNGGSQVTITNNTTVNGNTAKYVGGGIANCPGYNLLSDRVDAALNLSNSRVTANTAGVTGGGIANAERSTVASYKTTIAGNQPDNLAQDVICEAG